MNTERAERVANYKQALAKDADAQSGWTASDAAWAVLEAWDNANWDRTEEP